MIGARMVVSAAVFTTLLAAQLAAGSVLRAAREGEAPSAAPHPGGASVGVATSLDAR